MRLAKLFGISALSLFLTTSSLVLAQEQREEPKPAEEARPEPAKPAPDEMKAPRQQEVKPQKDRDEVKSQKQEEEQKDQDKARVQNQNKEDNKSSKQEEQKTRSMEQAKTSSDRGGRIPDDKFRAHFGRQHTFKVQRSTVGGQPRFQYGGYSFTIVDAWPAGWAYTDDCYIDYVDGEYFLFDLLHPGVRVALVAVL